MHMFKIIFIKVNELNTIIQLLIIFFYIPMKNQKKLPNQLAPLDLIEFMA